jgi:hypothetical protein
VEIGEIMDKKPRGILSILIYDPRSGIISLKCNTSGIIFYTLRSKFMAEERETPFSFTEGEYEKKKKKVFTFDNERKSEQPLFVEMLEDISSFEKTETCKSLADVLKGM